MKRTLFIILLTGLQMWALADDYQTEYAKGQADYKKGKYESAREHFMKVIEQKVYANVVSYLRLCNEKIDEQYSDTIALLKKEKLTHNREKDNQIHEVNNKRKELNDQLLKLSEENKTLGTECNNLQKQLNDSTLLLCKLRHQRDSLQKILVKKPKHRKKQQNNFSKDNTKDNQKNNK